MKKEEKTEITRAKIYAAAINEFGTNGYAAGSINNICKTGINKGLIYHNFKDKDELYLECVRRSCGALVRYIAENNAGNGFVDYMNARAAYFKEHEQEAYIFLEARTNPPVHLINQIRDIFSEIDELNMAVCERELSGHELRNGVSKEDALNYFSGIQRIYNIGFAGSLNGQMSHHEQLALHEMNIHKIFDLMLYGVAKGGKES